MADEKLPDVKDLNLTLDQRVAILEYNFYTLTQAYISIQQAYQSLVSIMNVQATSPEEEVPIVGGTIKVKDIPLDKDGLPTEEWSRKYCLCDKHTAMREAGVVKQDVEPPPTGLYL